MYLIQNYMFEALIRRISISKYKENFIIKGGFLLSSIFGVNLRSTMDIDTTIKGISINKEKLVEIINEIIGIDISDNIVMKIENIKDITIEHLYRGYSVNIKSTFDNLKTNLIIDITMGDVITYSEISYEYKTLFDNDTINIMTYNLETIIAEKFETVISRNIDNSRMKDYYDLYMFVTYKWSDIDKKILIEAIKNTSRNRNTTSYIENAIYYINAIEENDDLKKLWLNYREKYSYAKNITYDDLVEALNVILNLLK